MIIDICTNEVIKSRSSVVGVFARQSWAPEQFVEEFINLLDHLSPLNHPERLAIKRSAALAWACRKHTDAILTKYNEFLDARNWQLLTRFANSFLNGAALDSSVKVKIRELSEGVTSDEHLFNSRTLSLFRILRMEPTLDPGLIQTSFRREISLVHPDALVNLGLSPSEIKQAEDRSRQVIGARCELLGVFQQLRTQWK